MAKPPTLKTLVTTAVAESGLGLAAWCQANGLNRSLVSRWLAGQVQRPQIRTIQALAIALGADYATVEAAVEAAKN